MVIKKNMKTAVVALTTGGYELADTICNVLDDCSLDTRKLTVFDKIASLWKQDVDAIICVMDRYSSACLSTTLLR